MGDTIKAVLLDYLVERSGLYPDFSTVYVGRVGTGSP